jgi:hypothetical protein
MSVDRSLAAVDLAPEIHHVFCGRYGTLSQFYYVDNGSSLLWEKKIVIRIWPREPNELFNLVELHILPTDELFEFSIKSIQELDRLYESMDSFVSLYSVTDSI